MTSLFDFRLAILKQEIDNLQASIRNYNNIMYVIKGWAITIFSGSIALAIQQDNIGILIISLLSTVMFWLIETSARQIQKHFISRYHKIEYFLRSVSQLNKAWEKESFPDINFPDMIGRYSVQDIKKKTSFFYLVRNRQTASIYILQIVISGILAVAMISGWL